MLQWWKGAGFGDGRGSASPQTEWENIQHGAEQSSEAQKSSVYQRTCGNPSKPTIKKWDRGGEAHKVSKRWTKIARRSLMPFKCRAAHPRAVSSRNQHLVKLLLEPNCLARDQCWEFADCLLVTELAGLSSDNDRWGR